VALQQAWHASLASSLIGITNLTACGKYGAGIVAGRQLRRMRLPLVKTLSLSEAACANIRRMVCRIHDMRQVACYTSGWSGLTMICGNAGRVGRIRMGDTHRRLSGFSANGHSPTNPARTTQKYASTQALPIYVDYNATLLFFVNSH